MLLSTAVLVGGRFVDEGSIRGVATHLASVLFGITIAWSLSRALALKTAALAVATPDAETRREQELLEHVNQAARAAGVRVFDWDLVANHLTLDQTHLSTYGNDSDEAGADPDKFIERVLHPDDLYTFRREMGKALKYKTQAVLSYRAIQADGVMRPVQLHGQVFRDASGKPLRVLGVTVDMSAQVESAARLEEQANEQRRTIERLDMATEAAGIGIWDWDLVTNQLAGDTHMAKVFRQADKNHFPDAREFLKSTIHPEDLAEFMRAMAKAIKHSDSAEHDYRTIEADGSTHSARMTGKVFRNEAGTAVRFLGVSVDTTKLVDAARKVEQQAGELQEMVARFNLASHVAGISVWEWDIAGKQIVMDAQRALADKMADRVGPEFFLDEVVHPDDREEFVAAMERGLASDSEVSLRYRTRSPSGELITLQLHGRIFRDEAGQALRMLGVTTDITAHVRAAAEIQRQTEQQRALLEDERALRDRLDLATRTAGIGVWDMNLATRKLSTDDQLRKIVDVHEELDYARLMRLIHVDDRHAVVTALNKSITGETQEQIVSLRHRIVRGNGDISYIQTHIRVVRDSAGRAANMLGVTWNVNEEVEHARQLKQQTEHVQSLLDRFDVAMKTAGISPWEVDARTLKFTWAENRNKVAGPPELSAEEYGEALSNLVHPQDRAEMCTVIRNAIDSGELSYSYRYRLLRPDGLVRHMQSYAHISRDAQGNALRLLGASTDITNEVQTNELLQRQAEQERVLLDRLSIATQAAGISSWELDFDQSKLVWSDNFPAHMQAAEGDEFMHKLVDMQHPDDRGVFMREVHKAVADKTDLISYRYRLRSDDGKWDHFQNHARLIFGEHGRPLRALGVTFNITKEIEGAEKLEEQARHERMLLDRLNIATQVGDIGSWELDLVERRVLWSENPLRALMSAHGAARTLAEMESIVVAEDHRVLADAIKRCVQDKTDRVSYRYRGRAADGRAVHVQNFGKLILDASGRPIRLLGVSWDVSKEVEAAEQLERQALQLRDAERRLERASISSSEGHWELDLKTSQTWLSSSYHALLGYAEGALPTTYDEFSRPEHPDDVRKSDAVYERHVANGDPYDVEVRLRTASDGYRWFRRRGMAERDAQGRVVRVSGSIHDIHQQKLAEDALKLAQRRFERAINGTQDGLWELEASGAAWCSPRVGELLGYSHDEFASDTHFLRMFLHPDDANSVALATQAHFQQELPYDVEIRLHTKSGEYRWYRARATADRDPTGRPLRLSGSLQDVSEARAARDELMRATQAAEAANSAKSAFLANVSHEIRTPMNGIIGMTGLLLDTSLDRTQRDYAETIRGSADSLLIVINDILDFSKIEAGKLDIESIELDLRGNVEDVGGMMAFQAAAKNLELVVHVHPEVPNRVIGDPQRVRQCLINLVGNAVKFTREGEIVIEVRNVGRRDGKVLTQFEVRDTGIGIKKETLDTLFQPFVQADSSTTRHFGGTGLGLSIVRRLVEMMGGEVGVDSKVGKGSTFWFTLPLQPTQETSAHVPVDLTRLGRRILVVDDNETNRRVVAGQLMHAGYEVSLAGGGNEATQMLRQAAADNHPFEVVLADYELHDIDGAALGAAINSNPQISQARVVILTSLDRHGDIRRFASLGFAGYITKPVRAREMLECVDRVLSRDSKEWHMQSQPIVTKGMLVNRNSGPRYNGNVLLVEDNAVNQKVAVRFLERMGCKVRVADNGAEGVKAYREMAFDIVLMDLQMPVMDGLTATRHIREIEAGGPATPIVALTANAMSGQLERCLEAGMNGFLTKPIEIARLHEMLERFGMSAQAPEDSAAGATSAASSTPVDLSRLNELTEGDPGFAHELAQTFVASGGQVMQEVHAALAAFDRPALGRAAHKLKGASANVYAEALRALAFSLEAQAANLDRQRLTELIEQLATEFTRAAQFLTEQAPSPAAKAG